MSDHTKEYETMADWLEAGKVMGKFQRVHNLIRNDYLLLMEMTERFKVNDNEFNLMYRSCLRGLFSMIEADMYGLNNLHPYINYSDRDDFSTKFKGTFKQIAKTWNKGTLSTNFIGSSYRELLKMRKLRDELIHPKEIEHVHKGGLQEFLQLKKVFDLYDQLINKMMDDFFISIHIPTF